MATAMCSVERESPFELKSIEAFPKTNDEDGTQYTRVELFIIFPRLSFSLVQVCAATILLPGHEIQVMNR